MTIKALFSIPNLLTLANLFLGCMAIHFLFQDENQLVLVCIGLALLADFLDGWAARALKIASPIGKQLDSLADMVSFGLVPGIMVYLLFLDSQDTSQNFLNQWKGIPFTGFIITLASALRLAVFNVDETQTDHFRGLPTPANTLFFMGIFLIARKDLYNLDDYILHPFFLLILTLIFSYLLISPIHMFKPKPAFRWKSGYWRQSLLMIVAIPAIYFLHEAALAFLIVLYILLSMSRHISADR